MTGKKDKARRRGRKEKQSSSSESAGDLCLKPTVKDIESEEALWALYRRHCSHHNLRRTHKEMKQNFNKFKESAIQIVETNLHDPTRNFRLYVGCDKTYKNVPQDPSCHSKIRPTEEDLISDEALWDLYHRWNIHYNVGRSPEEMQLRFDTFKETVKRVVGNNNKDNGCWFCLYPWSDETVEEKSSGLTWYV